MEEGSAETVPEMERPTLSLARRELSHWLSYCVKMIEEGEPAWSECRASIISARDYLPDDLARRLSRALEGCATPYDVRITFASVQEHQLVG